MATMIEHWWNQRWGTIGRRDIRLLHDDPPSHDDPPPHDSPPSHDGPQWIIEVRIGARTRQYAYPSEAAARTDLGALLADSDDWRDITDAFGHSAPRRGRPPPPQRATASRDDDVEPADNVEPADDATSADDAATPAGQAAGGPDRGERVNLGRTTHECRSRWQHSDHPGWDAAVISVGTLDDGRWYVNVTGRGARAYPTKQHAWTVVQQWMGTQPGQWRRVPCYPTP